MALPPAISAFKLKLIQHRVLQIVVREGSGRTGNVLGGGGAGGCRVKGTKSMKLEQKWQRSKDYS